CAWRSAVPMDVEDEHGTFELGPDVDGANDARIIAGNFVPRWWSIAGHGPNVGVPLVRDGGCSSAFARSRMWRPAASRRAARVSFTRFTCDGAAALFRWCWIDRGVGDGRGSTACAR